MLEISAVIPAANPAAPEALTLLRAPGRRLCKRITPHGVAPADLVRTYDVHAVAMPDLPALAATLVRLATERDRCAVLAAPADPERMHRVRRLVHADPKTDEVPTLRAVPRSWCALDLDGVPLPAGTDPRDLDACLAAVLPMLPPAFVGAGVVVQATAGHGIKPGARIRLWCIFSRPAVPAELGRWLRGVAFLDRCSFRPGQPIYTAAPVFAGGVADPLPARLATIEGPPVPLPSPASLPPPTPAPRPPPASGDTRGGRYAFGALARAAARVRGAEGVRHTAAVAEAMGLARIVRAGLLTRTAVVHALSAALGEGRADAEEAGKIVDWALANADARLLTVGIAP